MRRWENDPRFDDDQFPPIEDRFGCFLILICLGLFWLIVAAVVFDWYLPWL